MSEKLNNNEVVEQQTLTEQVTEGVAYVKPVKKNKMLWLLIPAALIFIAVNIFILPMVVEVLQTMNAPEGFEGLGGAIGYVFILIYGSAGYGISFIVSTIGFVISTVWLKRKKTYKYAMIIFAILAVLSLMLGIFGIVMPQIWQ